MGVVVVVVVVGGGGGGGVYVILNVSFRKKTFATWLRKSGMVKVF